MRRHFAEDTLGDASQLRALVRASCHQCSHQSYFCARGLLHIIPPRTKIEKLRFKCTKCGSRDGECQRTQIDVKSGIVPVYVIRFVGQR